MLLRLPVLRHVWAWMGCFEANFKPVRALLETTSVGLVPEVRGRCLLSQGREAGSLAWLVYQGWHGLVRGGGGVLLSAGINTLPCPAEFTFYACGATQGPGQGVHYGGAERPLVVWQQQLPRSAADIEPSPKRHDLSPHGHTPSKQGWPVFATARAWRASSLGASKGQERIYARSRLGYIRLAMDAGAGGPGLPAPLCVTQASTEAFHHRATGSLFVSRCALPRLSVGACKPSACCQAQAGSLLGGCADIVPVYSLGQSQMLDF